jgi:hypothetical protein
VRGCSGEKLNEVLGGNLNDDEPVGWHVGYIGWYMSTCVTIPVGSRVPSKDRYITSAALL